MLDDLKKKGPGDRVESTSDVELEENVWMFELVETPHLLLNEKEIVVDASPSDEGALVSRNHVAELWGEAKR